MWSKLYRSDAAHKQWQREYQAHYRSLPENKFKNQEYQRIYNANRKERARQREEEAQRYLDAINQANNEAAVKGSNHTDGSKKD